MPRFLKIRRNALKKIINHVKDGYETPGKQERLLLLFGRKDRRGNPIVTRAVPYSASVRKRSYVAYSDKCLERRTRQLEAPNSRYLGTCHSHVEIAGKARKMPSDDDIKVFTKDWNANFDMLVTIAAVHPNLKSKKLVKDLMIIEPVDDDVSYKFVIATRHKTYGYPEKMNTITD